MPKLTVVSNLGSLADVAPYFGIEPVGNKYFARVLRRLRKIEERTGAEIVVQSGEGHLTRYVVNLSALRSNAPELFAHEARSEEEKRSRGELDKVIGSIAERFSAYDDRLDECTSRDDAIAREVFRVKTELTRQISELRKLVLDMVGDAE